MVMNIRSLIDVEQLECVYQPLWNITNWKIYGYEGLLRFPADKNFNPEEFFSRARRENCLFELDIYVIKNAIKNFPFFNATHELLFLNIFPTTLLHLDFDRFIQDLVRENAHLTGRIVFELNETREEYQSWQLPGLKEKVSLLKKLGFYVALDDLGQGAATLQNIIEFQPNYIKLDKYFSEQLASNKEKQELISCLAHYCNQRIILILEGIERATDLAQAIILNVPIVQGFLLGKPEHLLKS